MGFEPNEVEDAYDAKINQWRELGYLPEDE
jgi:hypothetical protein